VRQQNSNEGCQTAILLIGISYIVATLQLHSQRKVIAVFRTLEAGLARMPGPIVKRNKLDNFPVASDQEMSGNLEIGNVMKIGMSVRVQAIGKKVADMCTAKLARWQADIVYDQKRRRFPDWPGIVIRRLTPAGGRYVSCGPQSAGHFLKGGINCC
jgi:hypothetical protein